MMEKEEIIRNILKSLLPMMDKKALVLLTGGTADYQEYQTMVDELLLTEAQIAVTPAFKSLASSEIKDRLDSRYILDGETLYREINEINIIIIPVLTRNTLAKGAMGIQDNLVSMAIAAGFMKKIPILAVTENCSPNSGHTRETGMNLNESYNRMMAGYEERWNEFGAILIGREEFSSRLKKMLYPEIPIYSENHLPEQSLEVFQVLTMKDAQGFRPGQRVRVSSRSVITPLAREALNEKNIIVEIIEKKKGNQP
ncbi:flavoprotein [Clostridium boliviensis]|uniref:Flavoprotein n=1 Tax=Clostridium boliviensis TaxID=318465 RepID=A0ABU4GK97_9CLOT|nr:flavoprotein [Clostridium boliviensis]MDW2798039.1 flavoprotein [Clostridium boliviensis]